MPFLNSGEPGGWRSQGQAVAAAARANGLVSLPRSFGRDSPRTRHDASCRARVLLRKCPDPDGAYRGTGRAPAWSRVWVLSLRDHTMFPAKYFGLLAAVLPALLCLAMPSFAVPADSTEPKLSEYEASCGGPKGLIACADEILKTEEFIARMSRTANIGVSVTGCLIYCLKKHFPDSLQGRWCTTLKKAAAARPAIRQAPSLKKVMERCGAPRKRGQRVASLNDLHFVQREIVAPANPA
jgi:hypothetical protein